MQIDFESYKVFYYVAKLSNMTLAAKKLFISQPAVSQSIKQLEEKLGTSLFVRTPKGMKLTPEGEVLYTYIAKGVEQFLLGEKKLQDLLQLEGGEIRIGASDMTLQFFLLQHLESFHKLYPHVKIVVTNAPTPDTLAFLQDGRIDFGIVTSPVEASKEFVTTKVVEIEDIFIAGDRFSYLKGEVLPLSALESLPIICLEENTSTRKYVDDFLKKHHILLSPEFEIATSDLIVQFAKRNLGIGCVVSRFAKKHMEENKLFQLHFEEKLPPRHICIVQKRGGALSQAATKLLDLLIAKP
jgi:DNA-binding transcriptional LysR family regulator